LSGGSACGDVVVQALQAELMVQCQVWIPTKSMQLMLPPEKMGDIEQVAPKLTVAIGAAAASF
jgi:Tfp pilus assembly PilM family ATPase